LRNGLLYARLLRIRVLSRKKLDQKEQDLLISQLRELLSGKEPVLFTYLYFRSIVLGESDERFRE
jgi:hypothetical protein